MKNNFRLIKEDIDVLPILFEISNFLTKNSWSDVRARSISYHARTNHISLRDHALNEQNNTIEYYRNSAHIITNPYNAPYFTKTFAVLKDFEKKFGGYLERVMIVKLDGKSEVTPHVDEGTYYIHRDRYHLVLKTDDSVNFCGDESQVYRVGELWWFDNKKLHSVKNKSEEERIHLIFDISKGRKSLKRRLIDAAEGRIFGMIGKLQ
jgi:hypothetical protein